MRQFYAKVGFRDAGERTLDCEIVLDLSLGDREGVLDLEGDLDRESDKSLGSVDSV